jgi:hypothetical protein
METRVRTWLNAAGVNVAPTPQVPQRRLPLYGAGLDYFRLPRERWQPCLRNLRGLGFRFVEVAVPWRLHERHPGSFEWRGALDLRAFLELAADAGLAVILAPGPVVDRQLPGLGLPDRILADTGLRAVSGRGTPVWLPEPPHMVPLPSYAACRFRDEVTTWAAAVADIAVPYLAPEGPVAVLGLDTLRVHERRSGAYDHDYHPEALAWWRERHGDTDPPRAYRADQRAACLAWAEFRQEYRLRCVEWLTRTWDEVGFAGLARLGGAAAPDLDLLPLAGLARTGAAAIAVNAWEQPEMPAERRHRGLLATGSARPLPLAGLDWGGAFWAAPAAASAGRDALSALLATGIRGFTLETAVDRDRWVDALLGAGEPGPGASWLTGLLRFLDEVDWPALRPRPVVCVLGNRAEARAAAVSGALESLGPQLPGLHRLGPLGARELARDADARLQARCRAVVLEALDSAQIPHVVVDPDLGADDLADIPIVLVPTVRRIARATWQLLHTLAGRGARLVLGPALPDRDERDEPLPGAPPPGTGIIRPASLDDPAGLADDLLALAGAVLEPLWIAAEDSPLRCSLFCDVQGRPRVLAVRNAGPEPAHGPLLVPAGTVLREAGDGDPLRASDAGTLELALPGGACRLFAIDPGRS